MLIYISYKLFFHFRTKTYYPEKNISQKKSEKTQIRFWQTVKFTEPVKDKCFYVRNW